MTSTLVPACRRVGGARSRNRIAEKIMLKSILAGKLHPLSFIRFCPILFLAMRAGAGDLDHRQFRRKAGGTRRGVEALRHWRGWHLADRPAALANQKCDHRGGVVVVRAGEKCIAALDA